MNLRIEEMEGGCKGFRERMKGERNIVNLNRGGGMDWNEFKD